MAGPQNFTRRYALLGMTAMATATGTTLSCSPVVDLQGYAGALVLCNPNVTATNNGLVGRIGTASGSLSDIAGSFATAHTTAVMLEILRPSGGRYFNAQLRQGTSGRHGPIYVFGIGAESLPVTTAHTTTLTTKIVNSPGTGTATSS